MNVCVKIVLFFLYPFIYLFHPQMRKYHSSRAKYWLADNDFFKHELNYLKTSITVAVISYLVIFYGASTVFYTTHTVTDAVIENYSDAHDAYYNTVSNRGVDNADYATVDIVAEKEVTDISDEEYLEHQKTRKIDDEEIKKDMENEIDALLNKARSKKNSQN